VAFIGARSASGCGIANNSWGFSYLDVWKLLGMV
jgi:hypothetical protein